jgi:hypothetical protein
MLPDAHDPCLVGIEVIDCWIRRVAAFQEAREERSGGDLRGVGLEVRRLYDCEPYESSKTDNPYGMLHR